MAWFVSILCLLAATMHFATAAQAEQNSTRRYPLVGHGALELSVPESWEDEIHQPAHNLPPTIILRPAAGNEFLLILTPIWNLGGVEEFNSADRIKRLIEQERQNMAPDAAEKGRAVKTIVGLEAYGYYFFATDKAPQPGEWEYLLRAQVATGDLLIGMTFLTHEKESEALDATIEMARHARHLKKGGGEASSADL